MTALVTGASGVSAEASVATRAEEPAKHPPQRSATPSLRAMLARIDEVFPLLCPHCGTEMRLIAFVTEAHSIGQVLAAIGEPTQPPRISPPRGPRAWRDAFDQTPAFDPTAPQPVPEWSLIKPCVGKAPEARPDGQT